MGADVHFSPAPHRVVDEILRIASIGAGDVVYDLGCGDGRVVVAAAQKCGARGVGVDIDARLLAECFANARGAGVEHRVTFVEEDFFATDLSPASVVVLYLLDSINVRLRPKIFAECRPGTRVVTYSFEMGEWEPDDYTPIAANGVMLWVVPANVNGRWIGEGSLISELSFQQRFQRLSGSVNLNGELHPIENGKVSGAEFSFILNRAALRDSITLLGHISDNRIQGSIIEGGSIREWSAEYVIGTGSPLEVPSNFVISAR